MNTLLLSVLVFTLTVNIITSQVPQDCPPECDFGNYYDDLSEYTDYFNKSVEYATERHKDRVRNVMNDLSAELQPSVQLTDARIRESGELVKSVTERLLAEAPEAVQMCLSFAREDIEMALEDSTKYLKTCTDEMNRDSIVIMAAYDKEAVEHKKKVGDVYNTLLACNKNVSSNRFPDVFRVHRLCCVLDHWNKTRGILHDYNEFATQFFMHSTVKGREYIVNSVTCLEHVGRKTYMKIKEITDDILDCAGLTKYDYLD